MPTISELQKEAWELAEEKGFHGGNTGNFRDVTLLRLCLVHTEVSEAAQGVKRHWDGLPTNAQRTEFAEELANTVIRILDLAGCVGVDLEEAILHKMEANRKRPHMYGTPQAKI